MFDILKLCMAFFLVIQVVHPAPGNASGTLVNGILHHCSLPTVALPNRDSEEDDISDDEFNSFAAGQNCGTCETNIRPGIVHRLDKGTSGLLVVAKVILHHPTSNCPITRN